MRTVTLVRITKTIVLNANPFALIAPICYDRAKYISTISVSEHGTPNCKKPLTHLKRFIESIIVYGCLTSKFRLRRFLMGSSTRSLGVGVWLSVS